MAATGRAFPWKNASTLIVAARNPSGYTTNRFSFGQFSYNYNLLMLKRSANSSFYAKAYVFPGGAVEMADFSGSWFNIFARHGHAKNELIAQFYNKNRIRPPLYDTINSELIPEIGFRIAAIREAFEETGILFCKTSSHSSSCFHLINQVENWQERVHEKPTEFLNLCQEENLYPDIWSLFEWSNWLTPSEMGGKRYDTIFYLCVMDGKPEARIDQDEITNFQRWDPVQCLKEHALGNISLAPPQIYELSRMLHFTDLSVLRNFARQRQDLGTERWLPIRGVSENGIISLLPGDHAYPKQIPKSADLVSAESSSPAEENKFHRMVLSRSSVFSHLSCNVIDNFGHKAPINMIPLIVKETESAKL